MSEFIKKIAPPFKIALLNEKVVSFIYDYPIEF